MMLSWFKRLINHTGYGNNPAIPKAAVGKFRQCTKVWPSKLVEMKKTILVVKFARKLKKW